MLKRGLIVLILWIGYFDDLSSQSLTLPAPESDSLATFSGAAPFLLDYLDGKSRWFEAQNGAGKLLHGPENWGATELSYSSAQGDFRHPQAPETISQITFNSQRYQQLQRIVVFGEFQFDQTWEKNRTWSSIMNPLRGTPYVLADSIGGNWKKQQYALSAGLATIYPDRYQLNYGLELDYDVGIGAKTLDPRPLSNTYRLRLSPSLFRRSNVNSAWGASGLYERFKEDVSLTIRKPFTSHNLYRFKGLAVYDDAVPISSGYSRYYSGTKWGGALQHETHFGLFSKNIQWFNQLSYKIYKEETVDGGVQPMPAGDWDLKELQLNSSWSWQAELIHQFNLSLKSSSGNGVEYHTVYDPVEMGYEVSFSGKVFEQTEQQLSIEYLLMKEAQADTFKWKMSLIGGFTNLKRSYLYIYPTNQEIKSLQLALEYILIPSPNWQVSGTANANYTIQDQLEFASRPGQDYVVQSLLIPSHSYLSASYLQLGASIKRFLSLPSVPNSRFYTAVDLNGSWSNWTGNRTRSMLGLRLGAYY